MHKHTFYYFLGNKKYPDIYILFKDNFWSILLSIQKIFEDKLLVQLVWDENGNGYLDENKFSVTLHKFQVWLDE